MYSEEMKAKNVRGRKYFGGCDKMLIQNILLFFLILSFWGQFSVFTKNL